MYQVILIRVSVMSLVVLGVISLVFLLIHLIPGDPIEVMLGETVSQVNRNEMRHALELDQPLFNQWQSYVWRLLHGNLGNSIHSNVPVIDIISMRLPATLMLALAGLAIALSIALPLGIVAAITQGSHWDAMLMAGTMLGLAIPNFWLGPLLILLFSLQLGWFPVSGADEPGALILPALTLGLGMAALLARMIRSSLLEVLQEDYIRTAAAKGLGRFRVITRHALGNAMLPVLTVVGLQLGSLLGGAVITETVFGWPGIGRLTIEAIERRDYPVVQACILFISIIYVLINAGTDLAYGWFDPRVRQRS